MIWSRICETDLAINVFDVSDMDMLAIQTYIWLGVLHFLSNKNYFQNVTTSEYNTETYNLIEPFIYEWVADKRGSISAEHGIGFKKPKFLHLSKSNESIDQMKKIKHVFDPKGILNPYKVLP